MVVSKKKELNTKKPSKEKFKINISKDNLVATLDIFSSEITLEEIQEEIEKQGIKAAILWDNINKAIKEIKQTKKSQKKIIIAKGYPPKEGKDGYLELLFKPFKRRHLKSDNGDRIDWRKNTKIPMTEAGKKLGQLHKPIPGTPGIDVFGNEIPPKQVKEAKARPGKNVSFDPLTGIFTAQISGYTTFEDNIINLTEEFIVKGDLDLSIGNIEYDGTVVIEGNVSEDYKIKAKKNIIIKGMMTGAFLEADGDIEIVGGVKGKGKSKIIAGGNLKVKYLDEVEVIVEGDIIFEKEIVQSKVKSGGRVYSESGMIIASEVYSIKEIDVGGLGSDAGIRTFIAAGVDWKLETRKSEIMKNIQEYESQIKRIKEKIEPIIRDFSVLRNLSQGKRKVIKQLILGIKNFKKEIEKMKEELEEYISMRKDIPHGYIKVRKIVYPGVVVKIGNSEKEIKEIQKGVIKITENQEEGEIKLEHI